MSTQQDEQPPPETNQPQMCNEAIGGRPHPAADQGSGVVNADFPQDACHPLRSALSAWPKCTCGHPECPNRAAPVADDQPEHERTVDGDSETLTQLRARVHNDYERRQQYGQTLGRSL